MFIKTSKQEFRIYHAKSSIKRHILDPDNDTDWPQQ